LLRDEEAASFPLKGKTGENLQSQGHAGLYAFSLRTGDGQ